MPDTMLGLGCSHARDGSPLTPRRRMKESFAFSKCWGKEASKREGKLLFIGWPEKACCSEEVTLMSKQNGENELSAYRGDKENSYFFPIFI